MTACHSAANPILDQLLWALTARMRSATSRAAYDKKSKLTESNTPANHTRVPELALYEPLLIKVNETTFSSRVVEWCQP